MLLRLTTLGRWFFVFGACVVALMACHKDQGSVDVLRIGILPDQGVEDLKKRYSPLFDYIRSETGVPYELVVPRDYDHLLELFDKHQVDLAYFGGFTFMLAYHRYQAQPLVMRDVDAHFVSYFIAKGGAGARDLKSFKNTSFSFGSKLSTSGHLMARYFLKRQGIEAESFFKEVLYSGAHDTTAYWVRDGKVQLGAANSKIIDAMLADGRLKPKDISIVWKTPPYTDYVWAVQQTLPPELVQRLRDAFLFLTLTNQQHAEILGHIDAQHFIPAGVDDFSALDGVIRSLGLVDGK